MHHHDSHGIADTGVCGYGVIWRRESGACDCRQGCKGNEVVNGMDYNQRRGTFPLRTICRCRNAHFRIASVTHSAGVSYMHKGTVHQMLRVRSF
jgi:hypothetical protein